MTVENYQRIKIQSGYDHFCVFCTQDSLDHRQEEVTRWTRQLASRLRWRTYETTISSASTQEATERMHALFEHRFPPEGLVKQ